MEKIDRNNGGALHLVAEKVPPYSVDAEMCVLGAMLLDNGVIDDVASVLPREAFYRRMNQEIYGCIVECFESEKAVDLVLLKGFLKDNGKLEKKVDIEYLMEIEETVPIASNVDYYAGIVREYYLKRQVIGIGTQMVQAGYDGQEAKMALDEAEGRIFELALRGNKSEVLSMYDVAGQVLERIEEASENDGVIGVSTGFYDLDTATNGLHPGELAIVAARPSMGKTSFALNLLLHIGFKRRVPALFFSLEMSAVQLVSNLLCMDSWIDSHKVRSGKLSDSDFSRVSATIAKVSDAPVFIDESPMLTVAELRTTARKLKLQKGIEIVVVDYLQLLECDRGFRKENRQQEITHISRSLKALAKELEVPVVVLSQLNRDVEKRENHRPRLSDLRESGAIEQDADVVMLLHRPEYYDPDKEPGIAELNIAKQRNGPTTVVRLGFKSSCMKFVNLEEGCPK